MALLETKKKTANSLGFKWFSLNPGIATNYHSLLSFLSPVVAQYKWDWPFPANSFHLVNGVIDQVEAWRLPRAPVLGSLVRVRICSRFVSRNHAMSA
jgi:hypothetical protein